MQSEWAEESIILKQFLQAFPLSPLLLPRFYIFLRSFLLCTTPHYLNAWNRLWLNQLKKKLEKWEVLV